MFFFRHYKTELSPGFAHFISVFENKFNFLNTNPYPVPSDAKLCIRPSNFFPQEKMDHLSQREQNAKRSVAQQSVATLCLRRQVGPLGRDSSA